MSERYTADTITDDALDQLYDERDRYFHFACAARGASGARDFPDLTDTILALVDRAEHAEATVARVRALAERWRYTGDRKEGPLRELLAALDATLVGRCVSSHCVEGDHILDLDQPACVHPEGYEGECPCPPSCVCCKVAPAPDSQLEQLRAEADAWRRKAIRRALGNSQRRGAIEGCRDLVGEPITDRSLWGEGYRAAIDDLREVLQAFGQLEVAHDGPSIAECAADDRRWWSSEKGGAR